MTHLWTVVDRLAGTYSDVDEQRLARIVVLCSISIGIWAPVFVAVYALLGLFDWAVIVAVATLGLLSSLPVMRAARWPVAGANVLLGSVVFGLLMLIWVSGGTSSPAAAWMPLAPVCAFILVGHRSAFGWTALEALGYLAVVLSPRPMSLDAGLFDALAVLCTLGILTIAVLISYFAVAAGDATRNELALALEATQHMQTELVELSREAGKAEVATGVLHNVGNALTSVNIAVEVVQSSVPEPAWPAKVAGLLEQGEVDAATAAKLARFVRRSHEVDRAAVAQVREELQRLVELAEHMSTIVTVQQSVARAGGLRQAVEPAELVDAVVAAQTGHLGSHLVQRDYRRVGNRMLDRSRVSQILVNLVKNALEASVDDGNPVVVSMRASADEVVVRVRDRGVGIAAEDLGRIFEHGFTTKKAGNGFGLHHSFNAAREMDGTLTVASDGPETGATFELRLPARSLALEPA